VDNGDAVCAWDRGWGVAVRATDGEAERRRTGAHRHCGKQHSGARKWNWVGR
jgi:hypothetical protein